MLINPCAGVFYKIGIINTFPAFSCRNSIPNSKPRKRLIISYLTRAGSCFWAVMTLGLAQRRSRAWHSWNRSGVWSAVRWRKERYLPPQSAGCDYVHGVFLGSEECVWSWCVITTCFCEEVAELISWELPLYWLSFLPLNFCFPSTSSCIDATSFYQHMLLLLIPVLHLPVKTSLPDTAHWWTLNALWIRFIFLLKNMFMLELVTWDWEGGGRACRSITPNATQGL